jgi:hypothetical protein
MPLREIPAKVVVRMSVIGNARALKRADHRRVAYDQDFHGRPLPSMRASSDIETVHGIHAQADVEWLLSRHEAADAAEAVLQQLLEGVIRAVMQHPVCENSNRNHLIQCPHSVSNAPPHVV